MLDLNELKGKKSSARKSSGKSKKKGYRLSIKGSGKEKKSNYAKYVDSRDDGYNIWSYRR